MKILRSRRKSIGASTGNFRRYTVTAGMGGRPKSGCNAVTDKAYLAKLAKGVIRELEQDFDSVSYRITNDAIVFTSDEFGADSFGNPNLEYVQPLDGIVTVDWDLQEDIAVLAEDVRFDWTYNTPGF